MDILVNNVGRSIRKASTFDFTPEEFAVIIDTNFNSVLLLTQVPSLSFNHSCVLHDCCVCVYVFGFLCAGVGDRAPRHFRDTCTRDSSVDKWWRRINFGGVLVSVRLADERYLPLSWWPM